MTKLLLSSLVLYGLAFGQTADGNARNIAHSAGLPATCKVGNVYFLTGVTAGQNWYGCTATNTWTLEGGVGSGIATSINGTPIISQTLLNFLNSSVFNGLTLSVTNPSAGGVKYDFSGTLGNAGLTNSSILFTVPSWLTATATVALGGTAAFAAASGQTTHQVIGTCGAGTSFAPCALVLGDLPSGLLLTSNNLSELTGTASTARTNIGLGSASIANTGTSGHVVGFLDGSNTLSASQTFTSVVDGSGATHFFAPVASMATIVARTCTTGEIAVASDATAGQNLYFCTATNVWTQQLNTGATPVNFEIGGGALGTGGTLNMAPGSGILISTTFSGGVATYIPAFNSALIPTIDTVHGNLNYQASSNGTTAMTSTSPGKALTAYAAGQCWDFITDTSNPLTVNINGLGNRTFSVRGTATQAPTAGAILANRWFRGCDNGTNIVVENTQSLTSANAWLGDANNVPIPTSTTGTGSFVMNTSPTLVTPALGTPTALVLTSATGLPTAGLVNNAVTSAKEAVVNTYRTCDIVVGDTSGSVLVDAQLGPQKHICKIPAGAIVVEIDVDADAGSPQVIVGRGRCTTFTSNTCSAETIVNLVSSALAVSSGFEKCSNTGGTTGLDGGTTCSSTLQNTSLSAGDWIQLVSGTAGGTAKFFAAHIVWTVN